MMLSTDFTNEPAGDARARKQLADHAFCSWRAGGVLFVHMSAWLPAGKRVNSWLHDHAFCPRQPAVSYSQNRGKGDKHLKMVLIGIYFVLMYHV